MGCASSKTASNDNLAKAGGGGGGGSGSAPIEKLPPDEAAEEIKPRPAEPIPVEPTPAEPTPIEPTPVFPEPDEPTPVEPTPIEPTPVYPEPDEPTPVQPTPAEPMPIEPTPVDTMPDEPTPNEPTPAEPTPVDLPPPVVTSNEIDLLPLAVGGVAAVSVGAVAAAAAATVAETDETLPSINSEEEEDDVVVAVEEVAVNTAAPEVWQDEPEGEEEEGPTSFPKEAPIPRSEMGTFLHGTLRVIVHKARDLLDCDTTFGFNLVSKNYSDPDCKISMLCPGEHDLNLGKTTRIDNDLNPVWNESFTFYVCHSIDKLKFTLRDKDHTSVSDYLGRIFIEGDRIAKTDENSDEHEPLEEEWYDLETQGSLCVTVRFAPKNVEKVREVESYFPVMEGNKVTLYQDAETPMLPCFEGVTNADDSPYEPASCWKDLYQAIVEAEKFIYITGWSVCINTSLLRDDDEAIEQSQVGELLKNKADEGVNVIVVVWDERTSNDIIPGGFMGTHDEETFAFFADTNVHCFKHPRHQGGQAMGIKGMFRSDFSQTCYSHHQKTVILDAPGGVDDTRRIIAFVGGLDITDGRYDTPEFHLWSTLSTRHSNCNDFYNNCTPGTTPESGPRQPWHDIHAKIEGPAAQMVRQNFVERVMQQSESASTGILSIVDFDADSEAIPSESDGALWNVQLFRSITSESAIFDLDSAQGLHLNKGLYCENSIFRAYVQNIRNAQNYIYVENQYFLGSSFDWTDSKDAAANHTVPAEIAFKIRDKIAAGEPFAAYIVIPMFPEGDPSTAALQEILYWQRRTMQMMYTIVADAIAEHGAEGKPTDYLMFFCLAKREGINDIPEDIEPPTPGTKAELVRMTMRHPIYVHCKMLIVDDDYIIVGSANINQRSLGGNRDSEIAIGTWQPGYTTEEMDGEPRGAIHSFRTALWSAHLGGFCEEILNPASPECIAKVQEISSEYWERYKEEDPEHEDAKLLPYPVNIDEDGTVSALEEPFNCFPDTTAPVLGAKSNYMPPKLTT